MKRGLCTAALILVMLTATGCPPTCFKVTFPIHSQNFSVNGSDQLVMTVRFNKSVDMASLIAQTNVIVDAEDEANTPITITAGATPSEIVITTTKTVGDLLTFDSDGFFELRLQGSGANPVESVSGQALDGDGDGNPGGEFTHQYVLIGK